jgi:parallel beta-helix repeat protein
MMRAVVMLLSVSTAATTDGCFDNCTHVRITDGFLPNGTFIGRTWSAVQRAMPPPIGPLPGMVANASTMRQLTLTGDYVADVPLELPSRLHFRLDGTVHGDLNASKVPGGCPYGFQYKGACALVHIGVGAKFVSVSGGTYTCDSVMTAFGISCEGCSNTLIQNVTTSGCGQGNLHFFAAGPALEIKRVDSSGSGRGVWSQVPSAKVLITDSYFHHNVADGVDLDSMSANVMVRNNRFEANGRSGVFVEEGASNNIIIDNTFYNNSGCGVLFYTNLGGRDPGKYPTKDNWVVGNTFSANGGAISLGGRVRGNGATDTLIAENSIEGDTQYGWAANGAAIGNHVLTSDTLDLNLIVTREQGYTAGNVTFFAEPPDL